MKKLHHDTNVSVQQLFNNHENCNKSICNKHCNKSQKAPHEILKHCIWTQIRSIARQVASQARSLIENVDNNVFEWYNGVITKFVGGKRANYVLRRSYQGRCAGALVDSPDKGPEIFEMAKTTFLKNLEKTEEERWEIQENAKLQSESGEWMGYVGNF